MIEAFSPQCQKTNIGNYRIIQGGMGIRVSTPQLAAAVTNNGGIGTLSSVGLPYSPIYFQSFVKRLQKEKGKLGKLTPKEIERIFLECNLDCIATDVRKTKKLVHNNGPVFINIMCAARGYEQQVRAACEAGIDGIVSGAGLPLTLPEITKEYGHVALIPILSSTRGAQLIVNTWMKKYKRLPDAIVIEAPNVAGGHLGAEGRKLENVHSEKTFLSTVIPEIVDWLQKNGYNVPIIAAGGMTTKEDIDQAISLGASGAQIGTLFASSRESGFKQKVKESIVGACDEDIREYMSSACLPARALGASPIFAKIEGVTAKTRACALNCLEHCGYRDGNPDVAQMCILRALRGALQGSPDSEPGLWFVGSSAAQINTILSVKEIMERLR